MSDVREMNVLYSNSVDVVEPSEVPRQIERSKTTPPTRITTGQPGAVRNDKTV